MTIKQKIRQAHGDLTLSSKAAFGTGVHDASAHRLTSEDGTWCLQYHPPVRAPFDPKDGSISIEQTTPFGTMTGQELREKADELTKDIRQTLGKALVRAVAHPRKGIGFVLLAIETAGPHTGWLSPDAAEAWADGFILGSQRIEVPE